MDEVKRARKRLVATIVAGIAGISFLIAWMFAAMEFARWLLLVIVFLIGFFTMITLKLIMNHGDAISRQYFESSHESSNIIVYNLDGKNPDDVVPEPSDPVTDALRDKLKNSIPPRVSLP